MNGDTNTLAEACGLSSEVDRMTIQEQSVEDHAYGLNGVSEEPDDRDDEGNDETENTTIHDPSSNGVLSNNKKNKKKKKKRKAKKASATGEEGRNRFIGDQEAASSVKIARNKHMRYISSYHGPWLQMPHEILDSLLQLNINPEASSTGSSDPEVAHERVHNHLVCRTCAGLESREILRTRASAHNHPITTFDDIANSIDERLPPPIDPAIFRSSVEVRKLVDTASDLAVRAASGLSAAALGALSSSAATSGGSVAAALGLENTINGRSAAMSATRQHRLRAMAVAKLAEAYAIDEVAACVAVMQGATAIDDIAERVLRQEPANADALLVSFFHEKIPSAPALARAHAKTQNSTILDPLMQKFPERLHYYRSKGIWQAFKQDYWEAIDTFTYGILAAKALRKQSKRAQGDKSHRGRGKRDKGRSARSTSDSKAFNSPGPDDSDAHDPRISGGHTGTSSSSSHRVSASAPACNEAGEIGKEPGDDVERQLYFYRGMAYYQLALTLMDEQVLKLEGIERPPGGLANEGGELTLESFGIRPTDKARDAPHGSLLGSCDSEKANRYREAFGGELKAQIRDLLERSTRDFQDFLAYFAIWEAPPGSPNYMSADSDFGDAVTHKHLLRSHGERSIPFRGRRLVHHRYMNGRSRSTDPRTCSELPEQPALITAYHPLIIEAHFAVLLNLLLLGKYSDLIGHHHRVTRLMDYIEGYPLFVPARSLSQSQYAEVLELLACSWAEERNRIGRPAPPLQMKESEIAALGDLPSLHHLTTFFTEEHDARLEQASDEAERQAAAAASAMFKAQRVQPKSEKARRLLELAEKSAQKAGAGEDRKKALKAFEDGPKYNTARAEVAIAWLNCAVLPDLTAQEKLDDLNNSYLQGDSIEAGSSNVSNLTASSTRTSSPAPATLDHLGSTSSRKGKGKAKSG